MSVGEGPLRVHSEETQFRNVEHPPPSNLASHVTHGVTSNAAFAIIMGCEEKHRQANSYKNAFDSVDKRKLNFYSSSNIRALKFGSKSEHERFSRIVQKILELDSLQST